MRPIISTNVTVKKVKTSPIIAINELIRINNILFLILSTIKPAIVIEIIIDVTKINEYGK